MQSLKASFFTPNTLFLTLNDDTSSDAEKAVLLNKCVQYGYGVYLYFPYKQVGLGLEKTINLWLDLRNIELEIAMNKLERFNIGLLTAYLLKNNWKAKLNLVAITKTNSNGAESSYIQNLLTLTRMPKDTSQFYVSESLSEAIKTLPHADLNVLCINDPSLIDLSKFRAHIELFETSLLYTLDNNTVNALA